MCVVRSEQFVDGADCARDSLFAEGDVMRCGKLAVTLQRIADDPGTFYNGSLAQDVIADIAEYSKGLFTPRLPVLSLHALVNVRWKMWKMIPVIFMHWPTQQAQRKPTQHTVV